MTSSVQPRQSCTDSDPTCPMSHSWYWRLPSCRFPCTSTLQISLASWEARTMSGQGETLGRRYSQLPVWELTLFPLWFNARSIMSRMNDCFYQLIPSKIVHHIKSQMWCKCTRLQIFVPFHLFPLLPRLWIFSSDISNPPSEAERSFAFTTPKSRALSKYHRNAAKQQSWLHTCRSWL